MTFSPLARFLGQRSRRHASKRQARPARQPHGYLLIERLESRLVLAQVQGNLIANGTFEVPDLNGEIGNLVGWQTFAESGSHGQWAAQTSSLSPLSEVMVAMPPQGKFAAMLDEPDLVLPTDKPPGYAGMHILYQDFTIPGTATSVILTFSLYINNSAAYTNPAVTPLLDYFPNQLTPTPNQQVRVDLVDPQANITDVGAGVLRNLFITSAGPKGTFGYQSFSFDVTAFAGKTVRFRVASVNNQGKLLVGVDNVQAQAVFTDTTSPGVNNLRLRVPGFGATPTFAGNTSDPTIVGQVTDIAGISNIANVTVDLEGGGTAFSNGQKNYQITTFDAVGNFMSTLPLNLPGIYTVGVTVISLGGITSSSTITFNYQGPSLTNWQSVGPGPIQFGKVSYKTVSGHITSIALDPRDPNGNIIYVGTDNGGVWKSTDGGANWTPLTDYVTDNSNAPIPIAIGAVAVDPAAPNTVYAATGVADDEITSQPGVGVLKSTDGGLTWTLVGAGVFAGARVSKMVVSKPGRDGLTSIYVAVASGGQFGPGVYRSQDGGATWANVLDPTKMFLEDGSTLGAGHPLASVTDLFLDQLSDFQENIWIGMGNISLVGNSDTAGVWKSPDRGDTWFQVTGPAGFPTAELPSAADYPDGGGPNVGRVTIALAQSRPKDNLTIYVFVSHMNQTSETGMDANHMTDSFGLYKSSDGGLSWTHVMLRENTLNPNPRTWQDLFTVGHEGNNVGALAVDPTDANVVYVGGSTRFLQGEGARAHGFIRVDTTNMDPGTGDDLTKEADAAANMGNYPDPAMAGGAPAYMGEGVFWYDLQTTDAGQMNTGDPFTSQNALPASIHTLVFDPLGRLLVGTEGGLYRGVSRGWKYDTTDGGAGFSTQGSLLMMPAMQVSSIEVAMNFPKNITPKELGMTFTSLNGNLQIADINSITFDPYQRQTLDASLQSIGFIRTNGSLVWITTNDPASGDPFAVAGPFAGAIRTGPRDPNAPPGTMSTVYRIFGGLIFVSRQNGDPGTFKPDVAGISSLSQLLLAPLTVNPHKLLDPNGVYQDEILYGSDRAFETDNGGITWDQVSPALFPFGSDAITALAFGPGMDVFYVGTQNGLVFVDLHGGSDGFPNRSFTLPGGPINGITVDPRDPNTAYVMIGGNGKGGRHVFRTTNAGQSWSDVTANLPDYATYSMVIDPRSQPGAPNGKLYIGTQVGVYVSVDNAASWTRFGNGLPDVPVKDLEFGQNYEEILAGTLGRGAFMISTQFTGPFVAGAAPTTPVAPGFAAITVTFDHPIDPRTFTTGSIASLTGPGGPIAVQAITDMDPVNHQTFQITFGAQTLDGVYNLTVGSAVQDFLGNASSSFSTDFVVNSTDNGRFVTGLYHDLLSRTADTNGFIGLDSSLDSTSLSLLPPIAQSFVSSDEARADSIYNGTITAQHPAATGYYATLLGRAASPSEIAMWLQDLKQGVTPEQIVAAIASSLEFFQVTGGTDSSFVTALYTNPSILGRSMAPSAGELNGWLGVLSQAELAARNGIVSGVLESDEYRTLLITTFYSKYLGRPAAPGDISNWLPQLQRGLSDESFQAALLGSGEYFANHGSDNVSWLDALFNDVLGRAPDASGQATFLGQLQAGVSRAAVAQELLSSAEYRTDLIQADFTKYLGRAASSADVTNYLNALQSGATDEAVIASIVSSVEFFANQGGNDANWVNAVYQDVLGRPADSGGSANFLQVLSQAESSSRTGVVQAFVNTPEYRTHLITTVYTTYLQRAPSAQEINSWMPLLSQPSRGPGAPNPDEVFTAAVLSSREYYFGPQQRGPGGLASSQGWLTSLYTKVLGRAPDSSGLSSQLTNMLSSYQPQRLAEATTIDTSSEYRTVLVVSLYQTYLRRMPSPTEITTRVAQLASGTTDEQLISSLVSSLEYYQNPKLGNSDNATWLNQIYLDILGRIRDSAGSQGFLNGLNNGSLTRGQIADALLASPEYHQHLIGQLFSTYLGRSPAPQETMNYVNAITAGATDEQLAAQIASSDEYFQRSHPFP